jgi:hypothetical protein
MFIQYIKEASGGIEISKSILKGTNYVTRFNEESEYLYPPSKIKMNMCTTRSNT